MTKIFSDDLTRKEEDVVPPASANNVSESEAGFFPLKELIRELENTLVLKLGEVLRNAKGNLAWTLSKNIRDEFELLDRMDPLAVSVKVFDAREPVKK